MSSSGATVRRSARKAKGDGHLRRAEILQAAERIFVAEGYEGATIRKIADEVGVSSTALYMHFQDKNGILLEICNSAIRELLERNRAIAVKPVDAVVRVRMMLEAYMRWGLAHPNAYHLVYCAPRPVSAGEWPEETVRLSSESYEIFSGVVREIAAAGRLRTGTQDSATLALWMSCHGVVALLIARPDYELVPAEELIKTTLDGLMHGLVTD